MTSTYKVTPTGRCAVCKHVERQNIELLLGGGAGVRSIGRKFKLNHFSVRRHWENHVPEERKASMVLGPVQRAELAARVADANSSVIDDFMAIKAGLWTLYLNAIDAGDGGIAAQVAGKLMEVNDRLGKITGQLSSSPLLQINNNTTNVFMHPDFLKLQSAIIDALIPFPEARNALIAVFEAVEAPKRPGITYDG